MKRLIFAVVLCWGLWGVAEPALAMCTTQTVILPDGSMMVCQTCCYGVNCTTTCL